MGMNIDNCPRCGKIYVKNQFQLCPTCLKDLEQEYEKCVKYLRENKKCTIYELSEGTGVQINQITRFIREGRISIYDHPGMSYACDVCGTAIREGHICESCRTKFSKDIRNLAEDETRKTENSKQTITYNILNKDNKKH
ncbi:MAG: flagellar protein [Paenibacillus sp. RIFOXYA1_FULL_44_5]|nr:MAG: flagellar protein [Paenibacillus sp. RIFOXYA1_FULL_44_5]